MQNEKSKIDSNSYQLAEHLSMLATCVACSISTHRKSTFHDMIHATFMLQSHSHINRLTLLLRLYTACYVFVVVMEAPGTPNLF